jgi:cell division protein FtsI (penicillin-binding protein 3)
MFTLAALCRWAGGSPARGGGLTKDARRAQVLLCVSFAGGFALLAAKILQYGAAQNELPVLGASTSHLSLAKNRPDIVDRNGRLLATDIRIYWLAANPREIANADDAAEKLAALFPDLDQAALAKKFRDKSSRFEWVKRGLTPKQAEAAHALGLPALTIFATNQRVYPAGNEASHILGVTNVDNEGIGGIERYIDQKLATQVTPSSLADRPIVKLSLDLGVQHALTEELSRAMERYRALAALGIVLDVKNGEILASASLPDFDPNRREQTQEQNRQNRVVTDLYELGSVFKTFTIATALDQRVAGRYELFDAGPLALGRFLLRDPHAKRELMSVEDIFIHSSNTGAARIALAAGLARQQAFLKSLGFFERIETEAGASRKPTFPEVWRLANVATIAYGHGIAVPPLLFAAAMATVVNGGERINPTFLISEKGANEAGERVIEPETSATMRDLMRLVVERGTGRRAAVAGISIGGKTGTALKVKDGRYTHDVINTFVAAVPIEGPKYLIVVTIDEPKPDEPGKPNEAAYNAAPTAGAVIQRIAPMLDILPTPRFDEAAATPYEQSGLTSPQRAVLRKKPYEIGGFDRGYSAFSRSEYGSFHRYSWPDRR